jgi:hypothetical protein
MLSKPAYIMAFIPHALQLTGRRRVRHIMNELIKKLKEGEPNGRADTVVRKKTSLLCSRHFATVGKK